MYRIVKPWKEFNISLDKLDEQLKIEFPQHETNTVFDSVQAYGAGEDAETHPGAIELWFNQELSESELETLENLWTAIDEDHIITTSYVSGVSLKEAEQRARTDIISKTFDQLSIEQKSLLAGVDLTEEDRLQLLTDFPG